MLKRNWEVFLLMAQCRDTHFVPQKSTSPQNKHFGSQEICTKLYVTVDVWISELSIKLPRAVKGEYFAKGTEKCKIIGNLLDREMEKLEDQGCTKVQSLADEEVWVCSSYPFRHKTTFHCAESKANMFGNWIMRHLMFSSL